MATAHSDCPTIAGQVQTRRMAVSLLSRKYAKVPITKFKAKPTTMNPTMRDVGRLDLGEFFAAVPTDGQQQIQG